MAQLAKHTHVDGKPYFCKMCGAHFDEYLACDHGQCELEDYQTAQERFRAGIQRSIQTRQSSAYKGRSRKLKETLK